MDAVTRTLQSAVDDKIIAGAVLIGADRQGIKYSKAFGKQGVTADAKPMQLDTVMWVASCTKLMTAVSALQCVERGLFTLDEPVSRLLPEYAAPNILTGFDAAGSPTFVPATKPITLRRLLSHSSGMGYSGINPRLTQYRKWLKVDPSPLSAKLADYTLPLTSEPGEAWDYSVGIDWAGQMVERANGGMRLGEYMAENIWKPLGMSSSSFNTSSRPDLASRLCGMTMRDAQRSLVPIPACPYPIEAPEVDCGGVGSMTCAPDYVKMLQSLLRNDGKVLKPESVWELMRPQLSEASLRALDAQLAHPEMGTMLAPVKGVPWTYGLGGIVAPDGIPGRAGKGCLWWGGLPNLHWFIDPEHGTCGMYASQLIPPGDGRSAKLFAEFQKALFGESARGPSL